MQLTHDQIKEAYARHAYRFFLDKYRVNVFGIRNPSPEVDAFNDVIGVAYMDDFGTGQCLVFNGTTKPGLTYLKDKLGNPNGTGILIPGQYKDVYIVGIHNATSPHAHKALRQVGKFKVWRDKDKDGQLDYSGKVYDDVTGLNLHTTRQFIVIKVGGFSAACQVVQDDKEHGVIICLAERTVELYGPKLDYTLFDQWV
jgi:hypothetical protein